MKLTEWAALAEIVGGLGIIASLIFVGTEIQQNTAAIRSATIQAIADQDTTINLAYATDERLTGLFAKNFEEPDYYKDMPHEDWLKLGMALRSAIRRVENIYLHVENGVLEPEALERVGYGWYQTEFGRFYWRNARDGFDQGFAEFFDKKIAQEPSSRKD